MENHYFLWENPLFLWPFSIAMLNYHPVASKPFVLEVCPSFFCLRMENLDSSVQVTDQ